MELLRYGNASKAQAGEEFKRIDSSLPFQKKVRVNFLHFGHGSERTSDFGVDLRWRDVMAAIKEFSEMGHPGAIKIRNALDLAKSAEEAGWRPDNSTASN